MATTHTKNAAPALDAAFGQFKEHGEQVLATARKVSNLYLDAYEKAIDRGIEFELKAAGATEQEWLKALIEAQADFTRELTSSYTAAARSVLE